MYKKRLELWQRILYSFRQIPNGLLLPPSLTAPRCNLCSNTVSLSSSACYLYYIYGPEPSLFYPNHAPPTPPLTFVTRSLPLGTFPPRNTGFRSHFVFNAGGGGGGFGTRPLHRCCRCPSVLFSFRRWWLVHKNLLPTVCSSVLSRPNTLYTRSSIYGFTQKTVFVTCFIYLLFYASFLYVSRMIHIM